MEGEEGGRKKKKRKKKREREKGYYHVTEVNEIGGTCSRVYSRTAMQTVLVSVRIYWVCYHLLLNVVDNKLTS